MNYPDLKWQLTNRGVKTKGVFSLFNVGEMNDMLEPGIRIFEG
jgi:hypothetical protein